MCPVISSFHSAQAETFPLFEKTMAHANESVAGVFDSVILVIESMPSVSESIALVRQVTPIESSGPFACANESKTPVIDSFTTVSELT